MLRYTFPSLLPNFVTKNLEKEKKTFNSWKISYSIPNMVCYLLAYKILPN